MQGLHAMPPCAMSVWASLTVCVCNACYNLDVIILSLLIMGEERGGGGGGRGGAGWLRPQTGLPGAKPARQNSGFLSSALLSRQPLLSVAFIHFQIFMFKRLSVPSVMASFWFLLMKTMQNIVI
jgi:hypothetical protein